MQIDLPETHHSDEFSRLVAEHLYQLGQAHARQLLPHLDPDHTLVLIHPEDADTFGRGFLEVMGWEKVEWRILWQQVMEIPHVGEASTVRIRFASKESTPRAACLLQVFNNRLCRLRTQVLVALDAGVDLEALHVVSPWMPDTLWQQFKAEFPPTRFSEMGLSRTTDEQMAILLERYAPWITARAGERGLPQISMEWILAMDKTTH